MRDFLHLLIESGHGHDHAPVGCTAVVVVQTEPHVLRKYSFLYGADVRMVDLSALRERAVTLAGRIRAAKHVRNELNRRLCEDLQGVRVVIFDVGEGWFGTSLYYIFRELLPDATLVALQHGLMELTGPESRTWVRRLRVWFSVCQYRLLGATLVGAGFGNNAFDVYVCYGETYRNYILRLNPACRVVKSFGALTSMGTSRLQPRDLSFDILFIAQDLGTYGVADDTEVYRQVFNRLSALARTHRLRVRVKLHPKQRLDQTLIREFPDFEYVANGMLSEMLSSQLRAVVSFNSTGLLEAAYVGCPIVAICVAGLSGKWYAAFEDTVDLDLFAERWDLKSFSRVRPGEME